MLILPSGMILPSSCHVKKQHNVWEYQWKIHKLGSVTKHCGREWCFGEFFENRAYYIRMYKVRSQTLQLGTNILCKFKGNVKVTYTVNWKNSTLGIKGNDTHSMVKQLIQKHKSHKQVRLKT